MTLKLAQWLDHFLLYRESFFFLLSLKGYLTSILATNWNLLPLNLTVFTLWVYNTSCVRESLGVLIYLPLFIEFAANHWCSVRQQVRKRINQTSNLSNGIHSLLHLRKVLKFLKITWPSSYKQAQEKKSLQALSYG